ncbi:MAG: hypothetical protein RLZZ282_804 [Verrucomicrobiota bacterium]
MNLLAYGVMIAGHGHRTVGAVRIAPNVVWRVTCNERAGSRHTEGGRNGSEARGRDVIEALRFENRESRAGLDLGGRLNGEGERIAHAIGTVGDGDDSQTD